MRNPFAWCFGRGKKGRRKKRDERQREEPTADEPRLRYPLYDPRRTVVDAGDLPRTPSGHSSSPSVPDELQADEQINLPKDEEEEEVLPPVKEKEEERPEKVPQEKSPSPTPPPPPAPPTPPPATPKEKSPEKIEEPKQPKEEPPPPPPPKPPSPEPPKEEPPPPALSPPEPSPVPPGPPSTPPAAGPPSTAPEPAASVRPPSTPRGAVEAPPPDLRAPSSSQLADTPQMRKETAMSPLEKLASARMGAGPGEALEEAEAATAPCTPPAWEGGPVGAETKMQQQERTRQLQQKLLALEENLGEEEVRLVHDSGRRRRRTRREYPRYRVRWRCVQAAIDFYADAQDGILEDFRMRLDAHPPRTCRICRNFDFSDIPVLQ